MAETLKNTDRLIQIYGQDVFLMMLASYVAVCAEKGDDGYSAGEYWDKADEVLVKMGENAFKVGVDLVLLKDSEDGDRQIFIKWLRGQGWSVLAGANNGEQFRDLVRSERGEDVIRALKGSVELPVQVRKKKKLMFQVSDGYVKLTACSAALQLKGLTGTASEVYGEAEKWVKSREGRKMIGDYGAIPGFKDLVWYKRLVKAAR